MHACTYSYIHIACSTQHNVAIASYIAIWISYIKPNLLFNLLVVTGPVITFSNLLNSIASLPLCPPAVRWHSKKPSLFHSFEEPANSRQFHHDSSHSNTISHYQLRNSLQFFVAHTYFCPLAKPSGYTLTSR